MTIATIIALDALAFCCATLALTGALGVVLHAHRYRGYRRAAPVPTGEWPLVPGLALLAGAALGGGLRTPLFALLPQSLALVWPLLAGLAALLLLVPLGRWWRDYPGRVLRAAANAPARLHHLGLLVPVATRRPVMLALIAAFLAGSAVGVQQHALLIAVSAVLIAWPRWAYALLTALIAATVLRALAYGQGQDLALAVVYGGLLLTALLRAVRRPEVSRAQA